MITPKMIGRAWDLQTYQDTESFRALCWTQIGCLRKVVGDQEIEKYPPGYIFDPSGEGKNVSRLITQNKISSSPSKGRIY